MVKVGIVGHGEVGQALEILYTNKPFSVIVEDIKKPSKREEVTILNICFPYNDDFLDKVHECIKDFKPLLTIIHSTVLPGTTKRLQSLTPRGFVVHSPVRGNHPYLYDSLKRFVKYIGSDTEDGKFLATAHFKCLDLNSVSMKNSFSTELAKILCTTYYGLCIAWHQQAKDLCDRHNLEFNEVMTDWNNSYNEGYKEIHMENVNRPILYPPGEKIGGHCVIPNAELLSYLTESSLVDEVLKFKG